jgi:8-oxo-dGTP pyrophosphatase MutT (NUDIX family)
MRSNPFANPWKRLQRRLVYQNPWIWVWEDQVLRPDGQPGIYGVVHFRNRAIGVVALDDRDQVLLVGQYRYPLGQYSWEIPEGGGPLDEEPLTAAQRELLEETGFTAGQWREVLRAHLSNSVSDEEAVCFLATDLRPGTAQPEGTEQLQLRWVPFAEALRMTADGRITDSLSVLGLQRVALLRLGTA